MRVPHKATSPLALRTAPYDRVATAPATLMALYSAVTTSACTGATAALPLLRGPLGRGSRFGCPVSLGSRRGWHRRPASRLGACLACLGPGPRAANRALTLYGAGEVRGFRAADGSYEVELPFGRGSLRPSAVVGPEDLAPTALKAIGVQHTLVTRSRSRPPSTGPVAGAGRDVGGGGVRATRRRGGAWCAARMYRWLQPTSLSHH